MIDWSRVPRHIPLFLLITLLAVSALLAPPAAAAQVEEHGVAETTVTPVDEHGDQAGDHGEAGGHGEAHFAPSILWILPFATLLLCIAILPLIHRTEHWWEKNSSKLLIALILATITSLYYLFRGVGYHSDPGIAALLAVYHHAVILDYVPFIVLLFSLYTISGGINLRGDLPAHPGTNTIILGIGALIASFIGTTGAAMLLIRPLLQINHQRRHVKHTVIFFIFLVANIGGSLLPIGDPPLFLGYLRDVPFLWTLHLTAEWLFCVVILLIVYFIWDTLAYRSETKIDIAYDEMEREPLRLTGLVNLPLLLGVVLAVALLVPGRQIIGFTIPMFLREGVQLALAGVSWIVTPMAIRRANSFNFVAIGEVACLFIGIFITMMPAIEILNARGAELGLTQPWHFFWATGFLSSFLDNAPTYVVFFETAGALPIDPGMATLSVKSATGIIGVPLLVAISCGAVFMGANTYIGNGPNFMVKSIAEQSGVKMPSFFGYMLYSVAVLVPLFIAVTLVFFRG